ncbi:MAG: hypothetical protein ACXAEN_22570 [Candidatus Thorarchaeota archaeon]|jgi:hypothetical protein
MTQYEYFTYIWPHKSLQEALNILGKDGWELVTAYLYDPYSRSDDRTVVILKRELEKDDNTTVQDSSQ